MGGFLDKFRKKITSPLRKESLERSVKRIDDKIALGVLLWAVVEADRNFLPEEESKVKDILSSYCRIPQEEISVVLASIKNAAQERIDLYRFTSELNQNLPYEVRISIIENLFRVGCADKDLDEEELELIRKIANLFHLSHKDFIEAKIKIKKEFGLKTIDL